MYSSLLLLLTIVLFCSLTINETNCQSIDNQTDSEYVDKWIKLLDKFEDFVNPQTNQLLIQLNKVKTGLNVSDKCLTSVETLLLRTTKDDWALKMWDANGRWPSGLLSGSFSEFGDYDQCLAIKSSDNEFEIGGKFCFLELRPPEPVRPISLNLTKYHDTYYESVINYWIKMDGFGPISNGLCLPSLCSDRELQLILTKTLTSFNELSLRIKYCTQREDIDKRMQLRFGQKVAVYETYCCLIMISGMHRDYCIIGDSQG